MEKRKYAFGYAPPWPLSSVRNREGCSAIFADMLHKYPLLTDLGVIDTDGSLFCSAVPFGSGINVSEGSIFQQAAKTETVAVGAFRSDALPREVGISGKNCEKIFVIFQRWSAPRGSGSWAGTGHSEGDR
jgi:hypothetical protein